MKLMKKIILVSMCSVLLAGGLFAHDDNVHENDGVQYLPIYFQAIPGEMFGHKIGTSIAIGLTISSVYNLYGFQTAPVICITAHEMSGVQYAGVFSVAGNGVNGGQFSGVFNVSNGDTNGIQAAGIFNTTGGDLNGIQLAGVFNVTDGTMRLFQSAGIFNVVREDVIGVQAAGVFNAAGGNVTGIQAAGISNRARNVTGAQVAGVLNVARRVYGLQIGLINISDEMYGLPIGLINIVKHGIFDFSVWYDETGFLYTGIQKGTSNLYMLAYGGARADDWFDNAETLTTGLGAGVRFTSGPFYLDMDGSAKHLVPGADAGGKLRNSFNFSAGETFPSVRIMGGLRLFKRAGIFGGVTLDCQIPGWSGENELFHTGSGSMSFMLGETVYILYPKWFFGFKM